MPRWDLPLEDTHNRAYKGKKRYISLICHLSQIIFKLLQQAYSDRESNSDLLFRRELFYPLNYQSPKKSNAFMSRITMVCSQHEVRCKGKDKF